MKKSRLNLLLAVLVCFCMTLSAMNLSLFNVDATSKVQTAYDLPDDAMHFIVRQWHNWSSGNSLTDDQLDYIQKSGNDYFVILEGYIVPENSTYEFYYIDSKANELKRVTDSSSLPDILGRYVVNIDAQTGTVVLEAKSLSEEEFFSGFSVSAGHDAVVISGNTITIQYRSDVHLVKAHVFYMTQGDVDAYGSADESLFAVEGIDDPAEVDTAYVYIYLNDDDEHYAGQIVTDENGEAIKDEENLPDDLQSGVDVKLVKFYSTTEGLHTDKTASPVEGSDGRSFNLDLEAWYTEGHGVEVGMVLDASGSMAFASDTPEAINVGENPLLIGKIGALENEVEKAKEDIVYVYPQHDKLIGYYAFNNNSLTNSVTGDSAEEVAQSGQELGNSVISDGKLVINGASSAGIKLDAVPEGGSFTVSFSINKAGSGDANSTTDQNPADILYIGNIGYSGNYFRVIRESRIINGATGPHSTVRRAWLTGWQGDPIDGAELPDEAVSSISAFHNTNNHIVTFVYENGKLTSYFDGTTELDITNGAQTINPTNDLSLSDYNLIFNAFNTDYNGADIYVDDVFVYDTALNADEVMQMVTAINQGADINDGETAEINWDNVFLTDDEVNLILNTHCMDNSLLGVSGYTYFLYDPRSNASEYTPLAYWEGNYPSLIGYYSFDGNSLVNSVTGKSAQKVAQFGGALGNVLINDGKLVINSSSSAGIKLDAVPNSGSFTVSFTMYKSGSDASGNQNPVDIMYVGSTDKTGDYLRVIREGRITGGATGPHGTVRRAWITGWQGDPVDGADLPDQTVSSISAFHNSNPHTVTYVYENGKLTSYFDGTQTLDITTGAQDIEPTKALELSDYNIIFNAFNSDYNGADICIDDISVFDTAMNAAQVKHLYDDGGPANTSNIAKTSEGNVLGELVFGSGAGWYYLTHSGEWEKNYTNPDLKTGKRLVGIPSGAVITDDIILPANHADTLDGGGTKEKYTVNADSSPRFYIDSNGYLRSFFCGGKLEDCYASYVYELGDNEYVKVETLQRALGSFVTRLGEASPSSQVSAVRFSTGKIPSDELDKLVLLDWSNNAAESAGILSLERGEGGSTDYDTSANGVKQYNYGLTGSTSTQQGLQSFIDNLAKSANNDIPRYLIIFTDGKDTDMDLSNLGVEWNGSNYEEYEQAVIDRLNGNDGNKAHQAIKLAKELKDEGYTIFTVMLAGGPVVEGTNEYDDAHILLRELAGNKDTTDASDREKYFFSTDKARSEYKSKGEDVSNMHDADLLTQIFTQQILNQIIHMLEGYTVQDYIDPRFDLVDADGTVWHLNAGGKVLKSYADGKTETVTITDKTEIQIRISPSSDAGADTPYLCYDKQNDMYYLKWLDQVIPHCAVGDSQLSVWNAQFTVRAKDDFLGGNAVLTNGNMEMMNYVFHPDDISFSSGTDDMLVSLDDGYPSKGFPRTTVNIVPPQSLVEGEQLIYMGESLTAQSVIDKLKVKYYANASAKNYFEYLERYSSYTGIPLLSLVETIIADGKHTIPYAYLPNAENTNQTGNTFAEGEDKELHKEDYVGYLTYTWGEGTIVYPTDGVTKDTLTRESTMDVTYSPNPSSGDTRTEANKRLVAEDAYKWNKNHKPEKGEVLTETTLIDGDYVTRIVSGDIVVQLEVEADEINTVIGYEKSPVAVTYKADLYRTYNSSKVKVGTYTATYTINGKMSEDAVATATLSLEKDFASYVETYGLPIGTYTLEKNSASTTGSQWLKFGDIGAVTITADDNTLFENDNLKTDSTKEAKADEYAAPYKGNTAYLGSNAAQGEAYTDDLYALFRVDIEPIDLGDLEVEKQVVEDGSETAEFTFTIDLTLPEGFKDFDLSRNNFVSENVKKFALSSKGNGKWSATVTLCHNWDITIEDIPIGTTFVVTESDPNGFDLQDIVSSSDTVTKDVKARTATGNIAKDITKSVTFYNAPAPVLPELGGSGVHIFHLIGAILLVLSAVMYFVFSNMKRRAF